MSKEATLLEFLLEGFNNIKTILSDTEDIEKCLNKLKSDKNNCVNGILDKTKNLVDALHEEASKTKDKLYKYLDEDKQVEPDEPVTNSETPAVVNNDISESVEVSENSAPQPPKIKLVDINKLVDKDYKPFVLPQNNLNNLDTTTIILTSSDDEVTAPKPSENITRESSVRKGREKTSAKPASSNNKEPVKKLGILDESESFKKLKRSKKLKKSRKPSKDKLELYVPLPKIPCGELQQFYADKMEANKINRLTEMNNLKKRVHRPKDSDSEYEKPSPKKHKKSYKKMILNNEASTSCVDEKIVEGTKPADVEKDEDKEATADLNKDELSDKEQKGDKSGSESEIEELPGSPIGPNKSDEETLVVDKEKEKSSDKESSDNEKTSNEDKENDKQQEKGREDTSVIHAISSSDSEEEFSKFCKRKETTKTDLVRKAKKRMIKVIDSDSDNGADKAKSSGEEFDAKDKSSSSSSSDQSDKEDEKSEDDKAKKTSRRRIKRTKDSSSDEDGEKSTRKQIRKVISKSSLADTTKQAEAEEMERKARLLEKQKKYNHILDLDQSTSAKVDKVVLDFDEKTKKNLLKVNKDIVKKLKPHQANGVQFMWDACFESLNRAKTTKGSGCILAHCMGLGKTLQVIALVHTLLTNSEKTGVERVMVVCPLNTVLNWKQEFIKWLPSDEEFEVYELVSSKQNNERHYQVQDWIRCGGVLIIGYNMFRNLSSPDNKRIPKKLRATFQEGLVDPGPQLVICDEGHLLKNEKTHLSIAMNRIKTIRRIVLTGTPLQNNLKEYWCMVQFIKPNLLGTYKEYLNRFVNPITNGQYTDSTPHDIQIMRKRSHVLHKMLDGIVQRRDYSVLAPYLPPKYEYVLFLNLTETQVKLYEYYMDHFARRNDGSNRTSFLFVDFQEFQRICTHPRVLLDKSIEVRNNKLFDDDTDSEGSLRDFIDDKSASSSSSASSSEGSDDEEKQSKRQPRKRLTRAALAQRKENDDSGSDLEVEKEKKKEWWQEFCDGPELDNLNNSGKLFLLFQILKECEQIGDKILVFSQSLYSLNCIEYFLAKVDEATQAGNSELVGGHTGTWHIGLDYFRLDGSSSCDNRAIWCDMFNSPKNTRARLFLISTRAGGLGINLVAANRVVIFDVSWNPSHDIQSIYRVYRFGQTKPCYIYRFVTYGAMEMKIYERQVTKQAISKRVIDEQQIDRHYNQNDLVELYKCDLKPNDRPLPLVPKDVLLGEMLQTFDKYIYKYHEHQSLLENKEDEGLNEEERKAAWEEFENEKVQRNINKNLAGLGGNFNLGLTNHSISMALNNLVRRDNPSWSEVQIRGIIPALIQQLQMQIGEGDLSLYSRVQQELRMMQAAQAQQLKEQFYQEQMMRMITQQKQQANMLGSLAVDPVLLRNSIAGPSRPTEVIDLND